MRHVVVLEYLVVTGTLAGTRSLAELQGVCGYRTDSEQPNIGG